MKVSAEWKTAPISCTCEQFIDSMVTQCGHPTVAAYPAQGGGWMALCYKHALKHGSAQRTDALISKGERWE